MNEQERMEEALHIVNSKVSELAERAQLISMILDNVNEPEEFFPLIFTIVDYWGNKNGYSDAYIREMLIRTIAIRDEVCEFFGGKE